jgi:hypothetical protein
VVLKGRLAGKADGWMAHRDGDTTVGMSHHWHSESPSRHIMISAGAYSPGPPQADRHSDKHTLEFISRKKPSALQWHKYDLTRKQPASGTVTVTAASAPGPTTVTSLSLPVPSEATH